MSPFKIEMTFECYDENKEPLYVVRIFDRDGKQIGSTNKITKERAVKTIMNYCCVEI
jgi:hypothetical protein